jgi:hypothetical protein
MSTNHVSVRLDAETIARVDALAPQLSTQWRPATRSDVLRALILTALAGHEAPAVVASARGTSTGGGEGRGRRGKSGRPPR